MATKEAQKRWRQKNLLVKKQLNVMARKIIHEDYEEMAKAFELRGKAEAVTFACFVTRALMQQAEYREDTKLLLEMLQEAYVRDRDIYAP